MEILLTNNPIISSIGCKAVKDYFTNFVNEADAMNIATGFISNQSLATIRTAVESREHNLKVNMFVGMHSIQGFTQLQYNSLKVLHTFLNETDCGNVYLSPRALYHGKMYSFVKDGSCFGAFIGSSNLESFVSDCPNYIESDVLLHDNDAISIDTHIKKIIDLLGVNFDDLEAPHEFIKPDEEIFVDYKGVRKVSEEELHRACALVEGNPIRIPLKTFPKSNLNTYFGAGKIKGRFSRRDWYEVEIILSSKEPSFANIPYDPDPAKNELCHIQVITDDGYNFEMFRQGDYGKNFRSAKDLRILGRWIKRHMEISGSLVVGQPITKDVLDAFGKHYLVLQKTFDNYWLLKLE